MSRYILFALVFATALTLVAVPAYAQCPEDCCVYLPAISGSPVPPTGSLRRDSWTTGLGTGADPGDGAGTGAPVEVQAPNSNANKLRTIIPTHNFNPTILPPS